MASVGCSPVLGCGFSCAKTPTRPPIACLRLSLAVSCKMRNRHLRLVPKQYEESVGMSHHTMCRYVDMRTDGQSVHVAAQEKINAGLLENQIEKLKTEISSRNSIEEGKHGTLDDESPLVLELNDLRKENALLKDDIQMLKLKLVDVSKTEERLPSLENRHSLLEASLMELRSQLSNAQDDVSRLASLRYECKALSDKVENLQALFSDANIVMDQPSLRLQQYHELQKKVDKIEALVTEATVSKFPSENFHRYDETLQEKIELSEKRLRESDQEIHSQIQLFQESVREFHDALERLKEESKKRSQELSLENLPQEFWSHLLLIIDGWLLEKKISVNDAKLLREMTWKKDARTRDAYLASRSKSEHEKLATFLKLTYSHTRLVFCFHYRWMWTVLNFPVKRVYK
ncbi:hypothetical protein BHE74_00008666 [Ensete ventricosum]|nr:hypothetical protein BHE74_00008666 [Ensete ventricosum]